MASSSAVGCLSNIATRVGEAHNDAAARAGRPRAIQGLGRRVRGRRRGRRVGRQRVVGLGEGEGRARVRVRQRRQRGRRVAVAPVPVPPAALAPPAALVDRHQRDRRVAADRRQKDGARRRRVGEGRMRRRERVAPTGRRLIPGTRREPSREMLAREACDWTRAVAYRPGRGFAQASVGPSLRKRLSRLVEGLWQPLMQCFALKNVTSNVAVSKDAPVREMMTASYFCVPGPGSFLSAC